MQQVPNESHCVRCPALELLWPLGKNVSRPPGSKVSSQLRLNVCLCTLKACKYKRNRDGIQDDFLLKCNTGCKKYAADLALTASKLSQAFYEQMMTFIQTKSL